MARTLYPTTIQTFEHILALSIQDRSPRLQVLTTQELCQSQGFRFRRAGCNRLTASLLRHSLLGPGYRLTRSLSCPHACLVFGGLLLDVFDELGHGHAHLLGIDGDAFLNLLDLLRSRSLPVRQREVWHPRWHL